LFLSYKYNFFENRNRTRTSKTVKKLKKAEKTRPNFEFVTFLLDLLIYLCLILYEWALKILKKWEKQIIQENYLKWFEIKEYVFIEASLEFGLLKLTFPVPFEPLPIFRRLFFVRVISIRHQWNSCLLGWQFNHCVIKSKDPRFCAARVLEF
jgi:hypothetical protein